MKRALILGPGGLRGAYGAGVAATLIRRLGHDYFDSVYGCSAGAYTASYFAAGQHEAETIWRECLHGNLLMRWSNIFRANQPILDLSYVNNNVLKSGMHKLQVAKLLSSPVKLCLVVTKQKSGTACYFSPKTPEEFFLHVRASAAIPHLHPSVVIDGEKYIDGGLSDPLPIERALSDGHEEIIVVCNRSRLTISNIDLALLRLCTIGYIAQKQVHHLFKNARGALSLIEQNKTRVRVICPSIDSPVRWQFDSSKTHINQLVDLGIHDALAFLT